MPQSKEKLTARQKKFCTEYIKDWNGKQAAIRSGYAPKNAEITASKLLRYSKVQKYINNSIEKALGAEREQLRYRVLDELTAIAFDNLNIDITGMDREEIEQILNQYKLKPQYKDKLKALELLGKYGTLFNEKVEVDISDRFKDTIADFFK